MDKFPFWHRGLDQSFRNEPALGPKGVWGRGKAPWIALDREEVDACRSPFRDITAQSKRCNVSCGVTSEGRMDGVKPDVLWS